MCGRCRLAYRNDLDIPYNAWREKSNGDFEPFLLQYSNGGQFDCVKQSVLLRDHDWFPAVRKTFINYSQVVLIFYFPMAMAIPCASD